MPEGPVIRSDDKRAPARSLRTVLIAVGFVGLGLPAGALGAAWPSIEQDLRRSTTDLTVALVCFSAGYFVFGALAGVARRSLGPTVILVGAALAAAAGLFVIATAPSWPVLLVGATVLGSGGGALDTGLNVAAALHVDARTMNVLHACFAGGAALGPLLLAIVLGAGGSWRVAFVVMFVCNSALAAAFVHWSGLLAVGPGTDSALDPTRSLSVQRSTAIVALIAAVAIVYVGSEVSAGQWGPSLMQERGSTAAAAGLWIAGFWAGLGGGRLVAAGVAGRLRAARLLAVSLTVVVLGAALLWWAPTLVTGNVGFVLLGFGMSAVFPTVVSLTPRWVGTDRAPIAIGTQIAGSAVGGLGFPLLIGRLARVSGLEVLGPVLTAGAVVLVVLIASLERLASASSVGVRE
jgi:fucose permease